MPTQYQLTDQAIFSAVAAGGAILSSVPGKGTDKIGILRIDSKERPVLQDLEGSAVKTAFGVDRFHWDGKTDMCSLLQKASFKNHGKDITSGSKPTYKNITVSGMPDFAAPPPKAKPAVSAFASAASSSSSTVTVSESSKRKFDRFTDDMTEAELVELQLHVRSSIAAKKAAKKNAEGERKKMQAKLQKMQADEAKLQAERAKLQAALDAMCTGASAASTSPLAPPMAPPLPTDSAPASPAKAPAPLHRDQPENAVYTNFVASRAAVAVHYADVSGEDPAKSWTADKMRSRLISDHYSDEQLRLLANGAGIHGSIKKAETLRTHLGKHFSAMLSA